MVVKSKCIDQGTRRPGSPPCPDGKLRNQTTKLTPQFKQAAPPISQSGTVLVRSRYHLFAYCTILSTQPQILKMPASTSGDARSTAVTKSLGHVLVTGGSGGLASQIISLLLSRSATTKLSAIDLRAPAEPIDGCDYHFGDLTDEAVMTKLFAELKPNVVIHTASPRFDSPKEIMYKVNVEGTKNLVQVAQAAGVKAFVYTSSASVISDCRTDLINADEEYPLVTGVDQPEYYTHTKVITLLNHTSRTRI